MTKTQYEIERENQELKKKLKRKQQEAEELAMMGFMSGNMGSVYMMEAAAQASSG